MNVIIRQAHNFIKCKGIKPSSHCLHLPNLPTPHTFLRWSASYSLTRSGIYSSLNKLLGRSPRSSGRAFRCYHLSTDKKAEARTKSSQTTKPHLFYIVCCRVFYLSIQNLVKSIMNTCHFFC